MEGVNLHSYTSTLLQRDEHFSDNCKKCILHGYIIMNQILTRTIYPYLLLLMEILLWLLLSYYNIIKIHKINYLKYWCT